MHAAPCFSPTYYSVTASPPVLTPTAGWHACCRIITAVLLMTVGFGLLVLPAGNFNANNNFNNGVVYTFVSFALSSSMAAMVAVIAATCEYVFASCSQLVGSAAPS